jgi:hypothetical protein
MEALAVIGVALAGAGGVWMYEHYKRSKYLSRFSDEDLKLLKEEIDKGILMEDEFIVTYFNLLRNEGYMHTFGGYKKQAHDLLHQMIEESKHHKHALIDVKKHLKI